MLYQVAFFIALHLSVQQFQMPLEGLHFVKTLVTFGIINATDSLIQNIITVAREYFVPVDISFIF